VLIEQSFVCDESQVFDLRLRDEHAIERISMIAGQPPGSLRVQQGNVERLETLPRHAPGDIAGDIRRAGQPAKP